MNRDEYARLKQIVAGALSRPGADRAAYLSAQCGSDGTIRREVESLLEAADHAVPLYEDPTLLVHGLRVTPDALEDVDEASVPFVPPSQYPSTIPFEDGFEGTDRYSVRRRVGAGGMGVVYEVDDRVRDQVVALKTLQRRGGYDIYQLKREFRHLADIAHPNLVSLYDLVVDERQCFFTMELISGVTFVDYARQTTSSVPEPARLRELLAQLVEGIQELHQHGMQHGDIKPSNVLVTRPGRVVILDFGLTSGTLRDMPGRERAGTPAYLSPEQCRGGAMSNASDWYAVGVTLYHALTGHLPFEGTLGDVVDRKTRDDPRPVTALAPGTPPDLAEVCMAMLRREPDARLSGPDALSRLLGVATSRSSLSDPGQHDVFVGRETSLDLLSAAFATVQERRSVSVFIHGASGIGKSTLVQRFIDDRLAGRTVLVLRSRCHEHEAIPYKALDGLVDNIARHLNALSPVELSQVMPRDAHALSRLFPVMRVVTIGSPQDIDIDPLALQRLAFTAFRDLLNLLAARQPLVIDIDDFHWADADSVKWLTELLRPPSVPSLLTLVSFRSEELEAKPFLRSLTERVDIGERLSLSLAPMSTQEVDQLVEALRPPGGEKDAERNVEIARYSGGNPFLVETLARHTTRSLHPNRITFDDVLARRLEALPSEARAFLETLALCGRPVQAARVFEACGCHGDERPLVARLRAEHLVRNSRSGDRVELYHDRIREALTARLSSDTARRIHELLAQVLVDHGDDDPEALFDHYRAAGHLPRAAAQAALAARRASSVLAFDLAATFYRHALSLQPDGDDHASWCAGLGLALENAGRPVEAADAYLAAAGNRHGVDHLEWRRKAAELFLVGGQIDRGLRVIGDVLRSAGVRLARRPLTALGSLACRRFQLRLRGLDFAPLAESKIPREDLRRIDACWSLTVGMAMVDPLRAADFNVRQLLWALRVGDSYRVARALALEAGFSVIIQVGAGAQRATVLRRRAEALASGPGQQYVTALTSVWAGIAAFLTGRWLEATQLCSQAATILRDHCTGVTWELNLAQNFYLFSLLYRGELHEAAAHLPELSRSARERGNVYLELELSTRLSLVGLAADRPDEAERAANDAIARWSQRGFERPHYHHLLTLLQTRLYRGEAREAWALMGRHHGVLGQNQFIRVQHTRIETANFRARCALALAAIGENVLRLRTVAAAEAEKIASENMPWSNPFVRLVHAALAFQTGDRSVAVDELDAAALGFDTVDMQLYAEVCRHRLGSLVEGNRGRALRGRSERFMAAQGIRNPKAIARLIAPGFPD